MVGDWYRDGCFWHAPQLDPLAGKIVLSVSNMHLVHHTQASVCLWSWTCNIHTSCSEQRPMQMLPFLNCRASSGNSLPQKGVGQHCFIASVCCCLTVQMFYSASQPCWPSLHKSFPLLQVLPLIRVGALSLRSICHWMTIYSSLKAEKLHVYNLSVHQNVQLTCWLTCFASPAVYLNDLYTSCF